MYFDVYLELVARPARVQVVVINRDLADDAGERHRQLAAGVDVTEEDVGDRMTPLVPGSQASRIAGTCSAIQPIVSGRPLISTTTVGVPVATTASTSSSWRPDRSSEVRDEASPRHGRRLAHGDDGDVRLACEPDGLVEARPRVPLDLAALGEDDPGRAAVARRPSPGCRPRG